MDELIRELKQRGVLRSKQVEAAFRAIDRRDFAPPEHQDEAYGDYPLPIGSGQTISQPYTVAFMLDLLDPQPGERILDIGTGSGWQTALLAHIVSRNDQNGEIDEGDKIGTRFHRAQRFIERSDSSNSSRGTVYAVERIPELCKLARRNIGKYGFIERGTVDLRCGDATDGLPDGAPFDKIIAAAAGDELPAAWRDQLNIGGIIVAPIGSSIWRYKKRGPNEWDQEEFPGFAFVPLVTDGRTPRRNARQQKGDTPLNRKFPKRLWLAVMLVAGALIYALLAPVALVGPARIEIEPGSGSRAIADELKSRGLIRSKWVFIAYAALTGRASALKPGLYEFQGRVSASGIVSALAQGEPYPNERFITIPEGWDLRDIGGYLEQQGIVSKAHFYGITGEPARRYGPASRFPPAELEGMPPSSLAAKPASAILEGYLYPDTYRIFRDATATDIVVKMLDNFDRKLTPELREEIERQKKSIADVITMASLVEKEVSDPEDRRVVAGILWQRLQAGMALQADATVNYITAKHATPSAADIALDSPYNTYRYPGLPPTPIANPGRDAIHAAVYPVPNEYRYYLSTPAGQTIFSRTLAEHVLAKVKYLR